MVLDNIKEFTKKGKIALTNRTPTNKNFTCRGVINRTTYCREI